VLVSCIAPAPTTISSSAIATGECPPAAGATVAASVSDLARSPARYELKLVRVTGYYRSSFEHSAIYASLPAASDPSPVEGIWASPLPEGLDGQRVELLGYFTQSVRGHGGQWAGSLCVVSSSPARQDAP